MRCHRGCSTTSSVCETSSIICDTLGMAVKVVLKRDSLHSMLGSGRWVGVREEEAVQPLKTP